LVITTAVGSYPKIANRPGGQKLRRALAALDEGRITREELARIEDEVTQEVIQEQVEAGLDLITDGQVRWEDGQTYFARKLEGFRISGLLRYFDNNVYYRQPIAVGPIRWTSPIAVRDWQKAAAMSPKPVKAIVTGPYTLAKLSASQYHASFRDFLLELARALNQEALALQEAGAPFIQFDEPAITRWPGHTRGPDDWALFQEASALLTRGLTTKTALYTYFGDVADLPEFFALPFAVFGLDLVSGPANWDLLPQVPPKKEVALGILDARNVKLESHEAIAGAVQRALRYISADRLYVNPNCGLEFLPREQARAKLVRLVEGVRLCQQAPEQAERPL
jgi:5-methyltetrahydropteroyltriglutamate--homocysteine methyltransferase